MKHREAYSTVDVAGARRALAALHLHGIGNDAISLVARSDIELENIPNTLKEADTDAVPSAIRGLEIGGATGLLAGLIAFAVPPLGITLAGALGIGAVSALVGGWASALMGSAVPDPVRQQFESEIESGRVLVLVDVPNDARETVQDAMEEAGAVHLNYSSPMGAK